MLIWDETMSTGVAYIDTQHQQLIARFNELVEAITEGHGYEQTGDMLDYLQFYAEWHFEREERCMEDYTCPAAAKNKMAHEVFVTRFGALYEAYHDDNDDIDIILTIVEELADWITGHIMHVDSKLRHCGVSAAYVQSQATQPPG